MASLDDIQAKINIDSVARVAEKTGMSAHDAEMLLTRCKWQRDVALAYFTLASYYEQDVFYVFERCRWMSSG